jgi:proton-dependent oligopeptide transporter, POT family
LSPPRLLGMMFGIWFGMTAIANLLAGFSGSFIDQITKSYSLSVFFLMFTAIPAVAGVIILLLNKWIKGLMHGVE